MLAQGGGVDSWDSTCRGEEERSSVLQGGLGELCLKKGGNKERLRPTPESGS